MPLPRKCFVFSSSKWCILMHSGLWSTFYTNCNCHYDVDDINIPKLHMLNSAAKKVDPDIFVQTSGEGVQPS